MKKKTTEEYKNEVFNLVGDEYIVSGEYINDSTKIPMLHKTCGKYYMVAPSNFLKGNRCPYCASIIKKQNLIYGGVDGITFIRKKQRLERYDEFKEKIYKLTHGEYDIISPREEYIDQNHTIMIRHKKCGYTYETTPKKVLHGDLCHRCYPDGKSSLQIFKEKVRALTKDQYIVLGKYTRSNVKLKFLHKVCGKSFYATPSEFLCMHGMCPHCLVKEKKEHILEYLRNLGNSVATNSRRNYFSHYATYDFSVNKKFLITYKDKDYYFPVYGNTDMRNKKNHNKEKREIAYKKKLYLLEIPFWEYYRIDEILDSLSILAGEKLSYSKFNK